MRHSRIFDGILLILLGLFLLALNQGWIPVQVASSLVRNFWPALLILLGLLIILRGGVSFIVVVVVVLSLVGVGLFGPASRWFTTEWSRNPGRMPMARTDTAVFSEELQGSTDLAINLGFGAGRLSIEGGSQRLAEASLDYANSRPSWEVKRDGSRTSITAKQPSGERIPMGGGSFDWRFKVNNSVNLDINASMGAGRVDLDLQKAKLRGLDISAGAGDIKIAFPEEPQMSARISGGATNLELSIPASVGVSIRASNPLIANNLQREGLVKMGDNYISKDFESARSKLTIDLSAGVGNVRIRR